MDLKTPNQTIILTADTHLAYSNPLDANVKFKNLLDAAAEFPHPATTYVNAGDYNESRTTHPWTVNAYFHIIKKDFYDKVEGAVVITAQGNHQYTHPTEDLSDVENGLVDVTKFREEVSPYINFDLPPNNNLMNDEGVLQTTYYYMTDGNAHYIVTDLYEGISTSYKINITEKQETWFNDTLDYCKKDGNAVFVIAHELNAFTDEMKNKMAEFKKLVLVSGHEHHPFGICGSFKNEKGYWCLDMPSTRNSADRSFPGAYIGMLYDDCLVLKAFNTESAKFIPEYDEVICWE